MSDNENSYDSKNDSNSDAGSLENEIQADASNENEEKDELVFFQPYFSYYSEGINRIRIERRGSKDFTRKTRKSARRKTHDDAIFDKI